jgi:hypothetical protein
MCKATRSTVAGPLAKMFDCSLNYRRAKHTLPVHHFPCRLQIAMATLTKPGYIRAWNVCVENGNEVGFGWRRVW